MVQTRLTLLVRLLYSCIVMMQNGYKMLFYVYSLTVIYPGRVGARGLSIRLRQCVQKTRLFAALLLVIISHTCLLYQGKHQTIDSQTECTLDYHYKFNFILMSCLYIKFLLLHLIIILTAILIECTPQNTINIRQNGSRITLKDTTCLACLFNGAASPQPGTVWVVNELPMNLFGEVSNNGATFVVMRPPGFNGEILITCQSGDILFNIVVIGEEKECC